MSALPVYEVNFVLSERRLNDRRIAPSNAALPEGLKQDRRIVSSRRADDRYRAVLKPV